MHPPADRIMTNCITLSIVYSFQCHVQFQHRHSFCVYMYLNSAQCLSLCWQLAYGVRCYRLALFSINGVGTITTCCRVGHNFQSMCRHTQPTICGHTHSAWPIMANYLKIVTIMALYLGMRLLCRHSFGHNRHVHGAGIMRE